VSKNIAILGLGTMDAGMSSNLVKAGFCLTVLNRTAVRAEPLVSAGGRLASTLAEAAEGAAFLVSMLADDAASREIWIGKDGALEAVVPGAILGKGNDWRLCRAPHDTESLPYP
jgi:3-hydroxyisobutyrate dehydrogenase